MNNIPFDNLTLVAEFMHSFDQPVACGFQAPSVLSLGLKLIDEEYMELEEACQILMENTFTDSADQNLIRVNFVKELADLLFVVYWMAAAVGVDIDEAFYRVWESNMSKLGSDGNPVKREDGKVLKGPKYFKPKLLDLVKDTPITL